MVRKQTFTHWLIAGFVTITLSGCQNQPVKQTTIQPSGLTREYSKQDYERLPRDFSQRLQQDHYQPLSPTELSEKALAQWLGHLDPGKEFLLQKDLDQFQEGLWDQAIAGNLESIYSTYRQFTKRKSQRLQWLIATIEQASSSSPHHTLATTEAISNNNWFSSDQTADRYWREKLAHEFNQYYQAGFNNAQAVKGLSGRYTSELESLQKSKDKEAIFQFVEAIAILHDPHTRYYRPILSRPDFSLSGLGLVLKQYLDETRVERVLPDSPAYGSIKAGDALVAIAEDNQNYTELLGAPLNQITKKLRGPEGSELKLRVRRGEPGTGIISDLQLKRGRVKLTQQDVITTYPSSDIAVIKVPSFYIDFSAMQRNKQNYKSSSRDIALALQEVKSRGIEKVILDLRNNGGGALQEAATTLKLFLPNGPVLQIRNNKGQIDILTTGSKSTASYYQGRLIVMVNHKTAGTAEIVSAALQDYNRAIIAGSKTYGMGTIALMTPLSVGSLKVTHAEYGRVSGQPMHLQGVTPDLILESINNATDKRQGDQLNNISPTDFKSLKHPIRKDKPEISLPKSHDHQMTSTNADPVLYQALSLLERMN